MPMQTFITKLLSRRAVKTRLHGLPVLALGGLYVAHTALTLHDNAQFTPVFVSSALMAVGAGGWRVVVGEPLDKQTGMPAKWGNVGMFVCGIVGAVAGLVVSEMFGVRVR